MRHLHVATVRESCQSSREVADLGAMSRRQLLQVAGVATVGSSPAMHVLGTFGHRVAVRGNTTRVSFLLDGKERWAIDTRLFAGTPRLTMERAPDSVRVVLVGAHYPGTAFSADMLCDLRGGPLGPRLTIQMAFGGFRAQMSAEKFLTGMAPMRAELALDGNAQSIADGYSLDLSGRMRAEFRPNWTLRLKGADIAHLHTSCGQLSAAGATLALLDTRHPSVFRSVPHRRSRVTLHRGDAEWKLSTFLDPRVEPVGATPGGTVAGTFDTLHLELGEMRRALIAESNAANPSLWFQPDGHLLGADGEAFRFALQHPRYVRVFRRTGDETALIARFHTEPVWLRTDAFALQVGDGAGAALFELVGTGDKRTLTVAPALLQVAAPLEGAIVEPSEVKAGTRLELLQSRRRPARREGVAHLRMHPDRLGAHDLTVQNLTVSLLRPEDMLVLTLEYVNFTLQYGRGKPPQLVRTDPNIASVIVHFPPQHIGEEAYDTESGELPKRAGSVQSRLAGPSRLAFDIPASITSIPYTVDRVLNWTGFVQKVAPNAVNTNNPFTRPAQPDDGVTSIEAPYRMMLSPNAQAGWVHAPEDVTHNGITELWHTRLGVADAKGVHETGFESQRTMRAIWSPDFTLAAPPVPYQKPTPADPFRMSLDAHDRDVIVRETSDFSIAGYYPPALTVDRLMLTSLGAWMDLHGVWPAVPGNPQLDVVAWRHRMTMGRDQYVRVAKRGYLMPFGHLATYVTVTERKPQLVQGLRTAPTQDVALEQRHFIVVAQPERTYGPGDYPAGWAGGKGGRKAPFRKVRITTLTTPNLLDPNTAAAGGSMIVSYAGGANKNLHGDAFWPQYNSTFGGSDVVFHLVGEDKNGATVEFSTPLVFVSSVVASPVGTDKGPYPNSDLRVLKAVIASYMKDKRSTIAMAGQTIALAPNSTVPLDPQKPSDTGLQTESIHMGADTVDVNVPLVPGTASFFPSLDVANVRIPALKQLLGQTTPEPVKFNSTYIDHGLEDMAMNGGQMFVDIVSKPKMSFGKTADGKVVTTGVAQPNMNLEGISATLGATGGNTADLAKGKFDPKAVFATLLDANILGTLHLKDLFGSDVINDLTNIPKLVTNTLATTVETSYVWSTPVKSISIFRADNDTALSLTATASSPLSLKGPPPSPTYKIVGALSKFRLDFGVVALPFETITFTIDSGKKMQVDVNVGELTFTGPLAFMEELKKFLRGFQDPPFLDVTTESVEVGYTQSIPDVSMGAWSFQNLSIRAGILIPFFGDPIQMTFSFCTFDNPFIVTVYIFGGGGYFGFAVSPRGLERLEASIECGASLFLNLVVASGTARAMIGFHLTWNVQSGTAKLMGFVNVYASLTVLGLLTVSVTIMIGLEYDTGTGILAGEASVTVEVSLAFFHKSVTVGPVRKEFASIKSSARAQGAKHSMLAGPTKGIADVFTKGDWQEYCEAFG